MVASFLLDGAQLLLTLLLSDGKLLSHLIDDFLANSSLVAVFALLDQSLSIKLLTAGLDLGGDNHSLALIGTVEFILDHLESELVLSGLLLSSELLEALLDGWGCAIVEPTLNLDLEADGLAFTDRLADVVTSHGCGLIR